MTELNIYRRFVRKKLLKFLFTSILHTSTEQNIEPGKAMNIKLKNNKKY